MLYINCGKRKIWQNIKKSQSKMATIICKIILLIPLTTTSNFNDSHILDGKYFIFPEKRLRLNLKASQYQIWTSV